ncbi:serine hydrolase [Bifidobacterium mongoliense]|uniref:Beta-lactamase n=1 Tax=Bifidobacterium mongoliense DSM 21395 TaxID=1437603 RepID=A0A087C7I6_9BIFI|nr:serine hydrolase [Bifidobacterium mongoliense]KFI79236.1 beta-lactamase [Bifidobacterium mongoliense DSM 21395]MDN5633344.1 class A beta-lactamase-related serine hydrolase [Bifidobacterium mongoliense]
MAKHTGNRTRATLTPTVWATLTCLVIVLLVMGMVVHGRMTDRGAAGQATASPTASVARTTHVPTSKRMAPKPDMAAERKAQQQQTLNDLRPQMEQHIQGYTGDWQVYVEELSTGAQLSMGNRIQPAASLIKLYIMLAAYQQINDGTLPDTSQIDDLLRQMITVSSNSAANTLIETLGNGNDQTGFDVINRTARRYGFTQTTIADMLSDTGSLDPNHKTTSSQDCSMFMAKVYRKQLVSQSASEAMQRLLLGQQRRNKIPAGLPAGTTVANKTGEVPGVENDAAIVFSPHGDYVLTVMTNGQTDALNAQDGIRTLSSMVWSALTTS